MATVARMGNGEYAMSFEYCGTTNCQIYVKISSNGIDWDSSDMGDAVSATDDFYPASSAYIVWDPTTKQLVLSNSGVYSFYNNTSLPEFRRALFTNSNYGRKQWE